MKDATRPSEERPAAPGRLPWLVFLLPALLAVLPLCACDVDPDAQNLGDGGADADADADADGDGSTWDGGVGSPYSEPLCGTTSLAELEGAYVPASWKDSVLPALDARYAVGAYVLRDIPEGMGCTWDGYMPDSSSFGDMLDGLGTLVHEMGHCWGFQFISAGYAYLITDTIEIHTTRLNTFNRSEISTVHEFAASDFYFDTYLTGSSGAQGFSTVLDELNQYIHSLAVAYCYNDYRPRGMRTSARDGVLTFLYYVEKYLQVARTVHPVDYDRILADENAVHAMDVLWGRANLYLETTRGMTSLGINDTTIAGYVFAAANLDEMRLVLP